MKKLLSILTLCFVLLTLTACGSTNTATAPTELQTDSAQAETENAATETESAATETENGAAGSSGDQASDGRALVVYFSATGNTKALAETIAETTGAELYEIVPEEPYTEEDLNYNNDDCRANREMNDESARPAISGSVENMDDYDTIYLGYPIWWGDMPRIVNTFLESYDLSGKTIMPFCTSGGSGITSSVSNIRAACPDSNVTDGFRGSSSSGADEIEQWLSDNA